MSKNISNQLPEITMPIIVISPWSKKLRNGKENAKNYPHWKELVYLLKNNFFTIQVGVKEEVSIEANQYLVDKSLKELEDIIISSDIWISIDNFFPHLASKIKSGIVIWAQSSPDLFGYKTNVNLLKDKKYLRKDQWLWWENVEFDSEAFMKPSEIFQKVIEFYEISRFK